MVQYLQEILADSWALSAVVFVGVFVLLAMVGIHLLSAPPPRESGRNVRSTLAGTSARAVFHRDVPVGIRPVQQPPAKSVERATSVSFDPRIVLRNIYRALSALIVGFLLVGTVFTYLAATPANGLLLISGILAVLTLITFLQVLNFDRKMERRADPADRNDLMRTISDDLAEKIEAGLRGDVPVRWHVGAPEVYEIGEEDFARARAMLDEGMQIDEICRDLDGEYAGWSEPRQRAYQGLIRTALDHRL
ncbi:MAG TPA: hypothetical protein VFU20_02855 [Sphingomicrobium sp.]|nr:hypothetical protein [Sphingomicrobium sp.]